MTPERYYLGSKGPYTVEQLRASVEQKVLAGSALVRAEHETEGQPLRELLRDHPPPPSKKVTHSSAEEEAQRAVFCKDCLAGSSPGSLGNVWSFNGIGSKFYGNAERCRTCSSTVRILWFVILGFPILPQGTCRYRQIEGNSRRGRFVARRTNTRPGQVLTHWLLGGIVLAIFVFAVSHGRSSTPNAVPRPLQQQRSP
jgi:hypothetical protein